MLRRIKIVVIVTIALVLLSGCKLREKIGENITEGIINKATGGEVDIDIDGDNVTYKTEEGETVINSGENGLIIESEDGMTVSAGSEYEWPTNKAAAYLPKLKAGTVTYILNSDTTCIISIEEVSADDYLEYEETIVDAGFTVDKYETSAEDLEMYSGATDKGYIVSLIFSPSSKALQVTLDSSSAKN